MTSKLTLKNSWRKCPTGPRNYVMQLASCMSLLTEIVHYAVSVLSRPCWTVHCTVLAVIQPTDSLDCGLHRFGSQSPNLPTEIVQPS